MKKLLLFTLLTAAGASCDKPDEVQAQFGCVYGVPKNTSGGEVYVACMHNSVFVAGSNQAAVDKISYSYGIKPIDAKYFTLYSKLRIERNPKCNCR